MIRVAFIGCGGNMRYGHVPKIRKARGATLVAACDPVRENAERIEEAWGKRLALHADFKEMIVTEKLDAVVISTPHYQHYAQALFALEKGLHVLVEKPLTIRAGHARALIETAKKKRRILHVAYQRHHWPEYRYCRQLALSGKLGQIQSVTGYVSQGWGWRPESKSWRYDPERSGGGMLMDTGSHLVAASLFTSGQKVREVSAFIDNQGMKVDILAAISARFESGAICSLTTIGRASAHDERLALHGTKGYVAVDENGWHVTRSFMNDGPMAVPKSIRPESPDSAFYGWVQGKKGHEPPYYAVEVANISEAAYRSAKLRKPVRVAR
jgi:predicted dehydrogenase